MKLTILQYKGKNSKGYLFQNDKEHDFLFCKCRKDLILEFKLDESDNVNQWYTVSYFQVKPLNAYDLIEPDLIISNIEIVSLTR